MLAISRDFSLSEKMQRRAINLAVHILIYLATGCVRVSGTIDVNLSELEYLVARLDPFECRRLIAALHYTTYDLPQNLAAAGKILPYIPMENVSLEKVFVVQSYQALVFFIKDGSDS